MADDQVLVEPTEDAVITEPTEAVIETNEEQVEATANLTGSLTVKRGGVESTDRFEFQPPAIIGRFDPTVGPIDVDLGSLPEASYVSRKHAKIVNEDGVWRLVDLGSSNGSFVLKDDFERVDDSELADGDEIALGNARFVFRIGS